MYHKCTSVPYLLRPYENRWILSAESGKTPSSKSDFPGIDILGQKYPFFKNIDLAFLAKNGSNPSKHAPLYPVPGFG